MAGRDPSAHMILLPLIALGLLGSSCDDEEPSGRLDTSEISASIEVVALGDGSTSVSAALTAANPRYDEDSNEDSFYNTPSTSDVRLTSGDRLFAKRLSSETVKGMSRKMKRDGSVSRPRYGRSFEGDVEGTRYRISFSRQKDGRRKARETYVTLPPALELDWVDDPMALTPAPTPFSRSSSTPHYVVWDPFEAADLEAGDKIRYEVTGSCIRTTRGNLDWEDGEDVLQLTDFLDDAPAPNNNNSCPLLVQLTLSRLGSLDSEYRGGRVIARQVREIELDSLP